MCDRDDFYGSEEQNADMALIDSRVHPSEPQTRKEAEDYIEEYATLVNKLRREIETCALQGKDAGELIHQLMQAEKELDKWIDVRVAIRKAEGKELPF
jgi:hypothetical protein